MNSQEKKICIVGGGFAGIRCALDLAKAKLPHTKITLISDKFHFEYHAALYRVVTGRSPLEVCIAIPEILKDKDIEFVEDRISNVDLKKKVMCGDSGCEYTYDYLVLAVGSETTYFNVDGLKEYSFGFKTIHEALELKRHLHKSFSSCQSISPKEQECNTHIVVVGGGASGTELAAELAIYTKKLARQYGIKPSSVKIDLIERDSRVLAILPERISDLVQKRLKKLGVNLLLNKEVMKSDIESIYLKDMKMKTKTVVWTAGVTSNQLYSKIEGIELGKQGKVVVDEFLQLKGHDHVYVVGDGALTKYSGMASTAISHGSYVAKRIEEFIKGNTPYPYLPKEPPYIIPVGPGWAVAKLNGKKLKGKTGWFFRRWFDFKVFKSLLPLDKALLAFSEGKRICQTCHSCEPEMVESLS